jgi:hypothetical protein
LLCPARGDNHSLNSLAVPQFRYRFRSLPNNPTELENLAHDLQIPLAFTYRAYGIDATGQEITVAAPEAPWTGQIIDLMQALNVEAGSIEKAKPKQKAAPAQRR